MSTNVTNYATGHDYDTLNDTRQTGMPTANFRATVRSGRYRSLPDPVVRALEAREMLTGQLQNLYAGVTPRSKLAPSLLTNLTEGAPIASAVSDAVDQWVECDRIEIAAKLLNLALQGAETHLRDVIASTLPEIMDQLRAELDPVINALRVAYADAGELPIDNPDPLLVAQATDQQRRALVSVAQETRAYRQIRFAQQAALEASSAPVPGASPLKVGHGWKNVFTTGVADVSDPLTYGLPGAGQRPRDAVQAAVSRADVWLPGPDALAVAYDRVCEAQGRQTDDEREAAKERAAKLAETTEFKPIEPGFAAYLEANL